MITHIIHNHIVEGQFTSRQKDKRAMRCVAQDYLIPGSNQTEYWLKTTIKSLLFFLSIDVRVVDFKYTF